MKGWQVKYVAQVARLQGDQGIDELAEKVLGERVVTQLELPHQADRGMIVQR